MLKLLLSKDLKLWLLGEKCLSYTLSIPPLFNYQIVPSFSTLPTGISKIVDHPLRHNFDFSIFLGGKNGDYVKVNKHLTKKKPCVFNTSGYSQGKSTLKLNCSAYEKYKYGHLGCWYIKLTLFKRF